MRKLLFIVIVLLLVPLAIAREQVETQTFLDIDFYTADTGVEITGVTSDTEWIYIAVTNPNYEFRNGNVYLSYSTQTYALDGEKSFEENKVILENDIAEFENGLREQHNKVQNKVRNGVGANKPTSAYQSWIGRLWSLINGGSGVGK